MRKWLVILLACFGAGHAHGQRLLKYVDPMIGTGGHGHTYPGATVPFGMVQLSPDNGTQGWDWCSGYNYADSTITGFSHTHLSGTGCGDWVDISVMPHTGMIPDTMKDFRVKFNHDSETARPGYYGVKLGNGIKVLLTATERCGFHTYVYPKGSKPVVFFNLAYMMNYDSPTETHIFKVDDYTIAGYRYSKGWANVQRVYFAARLNRPIDQLHIYKVGRFKDRNVQNAQLVFKDLEGQSLMMKVALSSVNSDKAMQALGEIWDWDFQRVVNEAEWKWQNEMNKVKVRTDNEKLKQIFYTALYHTCMAPVLYSDKDGYYKNAKGQTTKLKKGQRYTVFSLWDTFRGLNPLFTLLQPERNPDFINSMLAFYDENGLLPVWDLSTWETGCMSGYHAVPVVADAVLKNTPDVDAEHAYKAMRASAFQNVRGTQDYIKYGYLPQDKQGYSVTVTLEYAYDDWCIAQVAKKLGKFDDYNLFMKRSQAYKLLFDKQTGFIRGKNSDGSWVEPFDPYLTSTKGTSMYEEGNAWQYTFFVPHDVRGLAEQFGTYNKFLTKLDSLFTVSSSVKGESAPPDVSGLIGQYAHGNEPSHHIAYMYTYLGQAWKTQKMVRMIMDSMYHAQPDGYAGNEDCGQMSAWAIWSMMGMYPANPASGEYIFGSPMFDEVVIDLPYQRQFGIFTVNNGPDNPYIQSVRLNGRPYTKTYIDHVTLMKGGALEFVMGPQPNKSWGANPQDWPSSVNN
ncbi:MAG: alpha,2-mannosidase [Flavipsychrobacter sp.]|jgi:predicted alpha-1,2-mannosidase|nr:alpha,2-mannosidase [Flavipsychrobacter sp.]